MAVIPVQSDWGESVVTGWAANQFDSLFRGSDIFGDPAVDGVAVVVAASDFLGAWWWLVGAGHA